MEIWLDTTNEELVKQAVRMGILQGVTTNPSIIAESGKQSESVLKQLLDIQPGPVTAQVIAEDTAGMIRQGIALHNFSDRIIVKVPTTAAGLEAVHELNRLNIATMATIIFHPNQVLLAAKAGARFVAPYVSRMEKAGEDAFELLQSMRHLIDTYRFNTKILAASIKNTEQIKRCLDIGIEAITLKDDVFKDLIEDQKLTLHSLEQFSHDWKKSKSSSLFA